MHIIIGISGGNLVAVVGAKGPVCGRRWGFSLRQGWRWSWIIVLVLERHRELTMLSR